MNLTVADLHAAYDKLKSQPPFRNEYVAIIGEGDRAFLKEYYGDDWREKTAIELSHYTPTIANVTVIDDVELL